MAAPIPDERYVVQVNKTYYELGKTQQAIIQDQYSHLQLMEPLCSSHHTSARKLILRHMRRADFLELSISARLKAYQMRQKYEGLPPHRIHRNQLKLFPTKCFTKLIGS